MDVMKCYHANIKDISIDDLPTGSFYIRDSTVKGAYTLVVKYELEVKYYRVLRHPAGYCLQCEVDAKPIYCADIKSLLHRYMAKGSANGLKTALLYPVDVKLRQMMNRKEGAGKTLSRNDKSSKGDCELDALPLHPVIKVRKNLNLSWYHGETSFIDIEEMPIGSFYVKESTTKGQLTLVIRHIPDNMAYHIHSSPNGYFLEGEDEESEVYPNLKSLIGAKMIEGQDNGMETALLFPIDVKTTLNKKPKSSLADSVKKNKTPINGNTIGSKTLCPDTTKKPNTDVTMKQHRQKAIARNPIKHGYSYVPWVFDSKEKHPYKNYELTTRSVGAQCQSSTAHYENMSTENEYMDMNMARRLKDEQYMDMDQARRLKVSDEEVDSLATHLGTVGLMSDEDCKITQSHSDDLDSYTTSFECEREKDEENDELDNVGERVLHEY